MRKLLVILHFEHVDCHLQVFFVDDKAMPGWVVVMKKEARGRRIISTEMDHILGQEESQGDREALLHIEVARRERRDDSF